MQYPLMLDKREEIRDKQARKRLNKDVRTEWSECGPYACKQIPRVQEISMPKHVSRGPTMTHWSGPERRLSFFEVREDSSEGYEG